MTNTMMNNGIVLNNDELLRDEQLDSVSGGGFSPEDIVNVVKEAISVGAASAEKIQQLVDSHEYDRMSNFQRERAIGKCLANNLGFCAASFGATRTGFVALQIKFRTVGVSAGIRELIEREVRSK